MSKRGPRQELRQDKSTGQFYYRYSGKKKYFGLDPTEAKTKWIEYEKSLVLNDKERALAEKELVLFGILEEELTDEMVANWIACTGMKDKQRDILLEFGLSQAQINTPELWQDISSGKPYVPTNVQTWERIFKTYQDYCKENAGKKHYFDCVGKGKWWRKRLGSSVSIDAIQKVVKPMLKKVEEREAWLEKTPRPIPVVVLRNAPGMSSSEYSKRIAILKAALRMSGRNDLCEKSGAWQGLKARAPDKRELLLITKDDFQTMLSSLSLKWQCIILLAANCGFSNTDIAHATWHHIRDGYIEFPRQKTKKKNAGFRRIPLWQKTIDKLAEWKPICKSEHYLFTTNHGRPYIEAGKHSMKDSLGQQFGIRQRNLGMTITVVVDGEEKMVPKYTFGTWRKSAATYAAISGANELAIKMLLGDSPNDVWRHYGQSVPAIVAQAVSGIASQIGVS